MVMTGKLNAPENFSRLHQNHDQFIDHACVNLQSQTTIVIEDAQSI
jgi:hypothetical protein